jgi:hypothetical protein
MGAVPPCIGVLFATVMPQAAPKLLTQVAAQKSFANLVAALDN